MDKQTIQQKLRALHSHLSHFDVQTLALFGSVARGEATTTSDIDFLVAFHQPATFDNYMELKFFLEDALACPVDLLTTQSVRPELKPYVERDLAYVFP